MYITVHRGTRHIGGSVIEVGTEDARVILDIGSMLPPLDGKPAPDDFQLDGLTKGIPAYDAVFISHHHGDHSGLMGRILPEIPVYTGAETERILSVIADFTQKDTPRVHQNFVDGKPLPFGSLQITPISVPHSAQDSYMFLLQGDGKNVLYTGDFKTAESTIPRILTMLDGAPLHLLVSEGTNIRPSRREGEAPDEQMIENKAYQLMKSCAGTVFVLSSSTNEERIQAIERAAERCGRQVYEDYFQAAARGQNAHKGHHFVARGVSPRSRKYSHFQQQFNERKLISAQTLAKWHSSQVIFVRASMQGFMEKYLKSRHNSGSNLLIYSIWNGYESSPYTKRFLDFCRAQGIRIQSLHASGHAYQNTIKELIDGLQPIALLPIHCEKNDRPLFETLHPNCRMCDDGERCEVL